MEKPGSSVAFWCGGLAIGVVVWLCVFGLYKLRVFIAERCDHCRRRKRVEDVRPETDLTNV
jgi:hypothetical protein